MRCTRCGTETSQQDTDEPVGWAALGPADESVRCAECSIGAPQATMRCAPAQLGRWVQDMARDNQLRRVAKRQLLTLMKSWSREPDADGPDRHWRDTIDSDSWSSHLPVGTDGEMAFDGVEEYLIYRTTRAEIVEYLAQAYGSAFVGDLLEHFPQLRAETLDRESCAAGSALRLP